MRQLTIEIDRDYAFFGEPGSYQEAIEHSRLLTRIAAKIANSDLDGGKSITVRDSNGNTVGRASFESVPDEESTP